MKRAGQEEICKKRAPRIVGICRDALALGVTREHLYRVLSGRLESRRLLNRYAALKGAAT